MITWLHTYEHMQKKLHLQDAEPEESSAARRSEQADKGEAE